MPAHPPPTIASGLGLITQRLHHSGVGRAAELTFAIHDTSPVGAQNIANDFQANFNGDFAAIFDSQVVFEKPFVSLGTGSSTPIQAIAAGAAGAGTRSIVSLSPQIAALVKKSTTLGGKKNRGRSYFPWVLATADVTEGGDLVAGTVTTLQSAMDAFLGHLAAAPIPMVIANKVLAVVTPPAKPYVTAINLGPLVSSFTVEAKIATQRRRMPRS